MGDTRQPELRRVLGLLEVTASGVGMIIGAGIFVLLSQGASRAGGAVWLSFGLAAVLCALSGLSYAEVAAMYPRAGAEFEYTRHAFSERIAFLVGWTMAAGLVIASAAIAIGFGHYVRFFVDVPVQAAAIPLLGCNLAVAYAGIGRSARVTVTLCALQVAALVGVAVVGVPHVGSVSLVGDASLRGVVGGAALVFFAFIGFDEVTTLAEETVNPTKVLPRALLLSLGISAVLYMAVAVAAVSVIGPSALAHSSRPMADVVAHVLGRKAEAVVAVVALLATMNTSLLSMTAGSRVLYGMASSGSLPPAMARVSPRTGAPVGALAAVGALAIAFASLGNLTLVASVTDFSVYVVFIAVNLTVILLRRRLPGAHRPFRVPGTIGDVPIIPVAALGAVFIMIPQLAWSSVAVGIGVIALGDGVQAAGRTARRRRLACATDRWTEGGRDGVGL